MRILVVGSGIVGLSVAFELALAGHSVTVITRNYEEGASWVAGGMLAPLSEGLEGDLLSFSIESLRLYPDFIRRVEEVSHVSLFFKRGIVRVATDPQEEDLIRSKLKVYKEEGFRFEELNREELRNLGISEDLNLGVFFEEEANLDSEKLMDALIFACENLGIRIVMDEIYKVTIRGRYVENVKGYKNTYGADFFIFTTGAWARMIFDIPVYPVKGQILKVKGIEPEYVIYSKRAYIIPKETYTLIGATTEDVGFDPRPTLEAVKELSQGAIYVMPSMKNAEFADVKVGFRPATPDEKPVFEAGENYFLSVGHYRNGILWAPISASIILDYIQKGVRSRYVELYSSRRFS